MNELVIALLIAAGFTIAAAFADMPKSRIELTDAMNAWYDRLLEAEEFYFEAMRDIRTTKMMGMAFGKPGMSDFDAWRWERGGSWLGDRLTFALFEHRRGRHLLKVRAFHLLDRFAPTA